MKMKRNTFIKKVIVFAVLFAVITVGAFAQSIPGGFVSPQNAATQGRIRSNADDFIRPDAYTNVSFERWYSMASFANTTTTTLGYATKLGGLYLGTFYSGTFWANVTKPAYTEETTTGGFGGGVDKKVLIYTVPADRDSTIGATRPANQIAVLLGVADMGFRLSFRSTYESFKVDEEAQFTNGDYKSFETVQGLLSPQIAWSMTKNLMEKGIKPWATVDLNFNRDWTKYQLAAVGQTERVGRSMNAFNPEFQVGLGGFTLANNNGWRTSADLEYRLRLTVYNNEYDYDIGGGVYGVKEVKGTFDGTTIREQKSNDHRIRPIISTQWNGEKLRLRAKLDLNVTLESSENNPMTADASGTLHKTGRSAKAFTIGFQPDLQLAAQYQAASKLFLNAGGRITASAITRTSTEGSSYTNGVETPNSSYKRVATSFGDSITNQFSLGVTVNPTDNLSVEANTGVSNTVSNNVNVFDTTNGAFVFGSVLVSLKF